MPTNASNSLGLHYAAEYGTNPAEEMQANIRMMMANQQIMKSSGGNFSNGMWAKNNGEQP